TFPPAETVHIACAAGLAGDACGWGPIVVRAEAGGGVTVWDVLLAIYEYYRRPMRRREVERVAGLGAENRTVLTEAYWARCARAPALPGYEIERGVRRVDCLGRGTMFWGLWVTVNTDGTWQMNLGVV
ncbi:hypothetical protein B0H21DRAFT_667347, partial [Amylocystis lapponica]